MVVPMMRIAKINISHENQAPNMIRIKLNQPRYKNEKNSHHTPMHKALHILTIYAKEIPL
jgi:hypothetical protein